MEKNSDNYWANVSNELGLETSSGYRKLFLHQKHYSNKPEKRGQFFEGDIYVHIEKAIEAIKLAEQEIKEKYNIKDDNSESF